MSAAMEINAENWITEANKLMRKMEELAVKIKDSNDLNEHISLRREYSTANILLGRILGCCEFHPNASIPMPGWGLTSPAKVVGNNPDEKIAQNAILLRGLNVWQQPQRN